VPGLDALLDPSPVSGGHLEAPVAVFLGKEPRYFLCMRRDVMAETNLAVDSVTIHSTD
jgi:hypothetical protein